MLPDVEKLNLNNINHQKHINTLFKIIRAEMHYESFFKKDLILVNFNERDLKILQRASKNASTNLPWKIQLLSHQPSDQEHYIKNVEFSLAEIAHMQTLLDETGHSEQSKKLTNLQDSAALILILHSEVYDYHLGDTAYQVFVKYARIFLYKYGNISISSSSSYSFIRALCLSLFDHVLSAFKNQKFNANQILAATTDEQKKALVNQVFNLPMDCPYTVELFNLLRLQAVFGNQAIPKDEDSLAFLEQPKILDYGINVESYTTFTKIDSNKIIKLENNIDKHFANKLCISLFKQINDTLKQNPNLVQEIQTAVTDKKRKAAIKKVIATPADCPHTTLLFNLMKFSIFVQTLDSSKYEVAKLVNNFLYTPIIFKYGFTQESYHRLALSLEETHFIIEETILLSIYPQISNKLSQIRESNASLYNKIKNDVRTGPKDIKVIVAKVITTFYSDNYAIFSKLYELIKIDIKLRELLGDTNNDAYIKVGQATVKHPYILYYGNLFPKATFQEFATHLCNNNDVSQSLMNCFSQKILQALTTNEPNNLCTKLISAKSIQEEKALVKELIGIEIEPTYSRYENLGISTLFKAIKIKVMQQIISQHDPAMLRYVFSEDLLFNFAHNLYNTHDVTQSLVTYFLPLIQSARRYQSPIDTKILQATTPAAKIAIIKELIYVPILPEQEIIAKIFTAIETAAKISQPPSLTSGSSHSSNPHYFFRNEPSLHENEDEDEDEDEFEPEPEPEPENPSESDDGENNMENSNKKPRNR